ncbi:hypothetical protein D3C80_1879450 [compost metagenome]
MQYSEEAGIHIDKQMRKHFEEVTQAKFWKADNVSLDFTRNGECYADEDINLMWIGYQSSIQNVVWDQFKVRFHLEFQEGLLTRFS